MFDHNSGTSRPTFPQFRLTFTSYRAYVSIDINASIRVPDSKYEILLWETN